ncbi:MAG: YkgJ family cysteine cluster protein [Chthoniobacter sp.]|uniref:YkgJ family cysteine cluster protein n=1 Tax=Chthoniobacter sp. TaxID=2510640 RepID=UPI0032A3F89F
MAEFSTQQLIDDIAQSLSPEQYDHAVGRSFAAFDALNEKIIAEKGVKLDCGAGCSVCCSLRVEVFAHEIFLLARHIRRHFSAEAISALLERLAGHAEKVLPLTVFEHATQNIICPLLQDGHCSVYAARPQCCRRHHSQDLAACVFTFDHPDDLEFPGAHDRDLFRALTGAMQENIDAYAELGFDHTIYELGTALEEALHDPASWKRWRAHEQAFLHASVTPTD